VVTVTTADAFTETPGGFAIDPGSPACHAELVRRLGGPATVVVDLRLLGEQDPGADGRDDLPSLARLFDAWGEHGDGARVILATSGAQAVTDGETPHPRQAAAATLPMVGNQEYLNLDCSAVDLHPDAGPAGIAAALATEIRNPSGEVFTAYRDGRRLVRTFTPAPVPGETRSVRENGTYLITGGLGDVGLLV